MNRKVRVTVNHGVCVGSSSCTATTPRVFALNENRQSRVIDSQGDTWDHVLEAAENCPVSAITVEDEDTNEQLFP